MCEWVLVTLSATMAAMAARSLSRKRGEVSSDIIALQAIRQEAILDRRSFLVCFRGLLAMKAVSAVRSAWRIPLFRLRA